MLTSSSLPIPHYLQVTNIRMFRKPKPRPNPLYPRLQLALRFFLSVALCICEIILHELVLGFLRVQLSERYSPINQKYYQWEDEWKPLVRSCWEKCIKGKFPDLLKRARNKAKYLAIKEGIEIGNDLSVILPFKPIWISQEVWVALVEIWNTDSWKSKSSIISENRKKETGGRHTLGSKSFVTVRKDLDKTLKRRATLDEFWMQTHAKKGSRPLDRLAGTGGSVGDVLGVADDVEENIQEHNVNWVDTRAGETIVQRLKEQISELERDKVEKNAMMEKIEENARLYAEMSEKVQMLSQNLPQNIPSS